MTKENMFLNFTEKYGKNCFVVLNIWEEGKQNYVMDVLLPDGRIVKNMKASIVWHGDSFDEIPYCRNLKSYTLCKYYGNIYLDIDTSIMRAVYWRDKHYKHEVYRVDKIRKLTNTEVRIVKE